MTLDTACNALDNRDIHAGLIAARERGGRTLPRLFYRHQSVQG